MINDVPNIVGVPPQLLLAINDRLRQLSTQLAAAQATITSLQSAQSAAAAEPVQSVNGQTGTVKLTAADVSAIPSTGSFLTGTQHGGAGTHLASVTLDSFGRITAVTWS